MANFVQTTNNQSALAIQEIKYQLIDGTEVVLNEQVVRNLTNNNQNITNGEIQLFVEQARMLKVNPLTKEYMIVKYDNSKPAQYILSINAFQRVADNNENFDGMEDGIVVQKTNGEIVERDGCIVYPKELLLGGWARVYRRDRRIPIVAKLDIKEYSKGQSTWSSMKATMINKCAKVACLRKAFPSLFSGMYSEEELENSGAIQNQNDTQPKREYDIDGVVNELPKENGEVVIDNVPPQQPTYNQPAPQPMPNQNYVPQNNVNIEPNNVNQNTIYQQPQPNYSQPNLQPNVSYNYDQNGVIMENNQNYNNGVYQQPMPNQMQQPQQFEISYIEYKNNKDKYEMVQNSYNSQTKTCWVIPKQ